MDLQLRLFDAAIALAGALGGWVLNSVRMSVRDLQQADKELAEKVGRVEVLVAGDYVRKEDFAQAMMDLKHTLMRIEDKLDRKQDRGHLAS